MHCMEKQRAWIGLPDNNLTDQNKEDLKTNIGKKLGLSEYFVRINPVYNVFTNAETVAIRKG